MCWSKGSSQPSEEKKMAKANYTTTVCGANAVVCDSSYCSNHGTCCKSSDIDSKSFICNCDDGWAPLICDKQSYEDSQSKHAMEAFGAVSAVSAILAVIVIIVFIVLVFLQVRYYRNRKERKFVKDEFEMKTRVPLSDERDTESNENKSRTHQPGYSWRESSSRKIKSQTTRIASSRSFPEDLNKIGLPLTASAIGMAGIWMCIGAGERGGGGGRGILNSDSCTSPVFRSLNPSLILEDGDNPSGSNQLQQPRNEANTAPVQPGSPGTLETAI